MITDCKTNREARSDNSDAKGVWEPPNLISLNIHSDTRADPLNSGADGQEFDGS